MSVLDAYFREIVGWQVTNHMRASLTRDALDIALSARLRAGEGIAGLIHHSDRCVQGGFNCSLQHLDFGGVPRGDRGLIQKDSGCSRGDSYDNAMAEVLKLAFKAELIDRHSWPSLTDVLVATSEWIG